MTAADGTSNEVTGDDVTAMRDDSPRQRRRRSSRTTRMSQQHNDDDLNRRGDEEVEDDKDYEQLGDSCSFSSAIYEACLAPIMDSLKEETMSHASSFDITMSWHVPWLNDTEVTYSGSTRTGKFRKGCGALVNHPNSQTIILGLITVNAILMGLMTFDFVQTNPQVWKGMEISDYTFLALFAVEVILQLIYHGRQSFKDPWLLFDIAILCTSWVPEIRIFRFARVINRLRPLQNLTRAIASVVTQLGAIALFIFIVIYTFAVLFTELFREVQFEDHQYFETLFTSMFTCVEMTTLEWAHIARELQAQQLSWLPICAFVVICGVIFFNLILAVICDAVAVLGVDWTGRNAHEQKIIEELQGQIDVAQGRIEKMRSLMTQLVKNQNSTLHLLEVQLARQLNNVETWANLCSATQEDTVPKEAAHRETLLSRLTNDYRFQERTLIDKISIVSGVIIEADIVQAIIFTIICIDSTMMGVATFDFVNDNDFAVYVFETISFAFLIVYTVECALELFHRGFSKFTDPWFVFDFFIVVTSWLLDLLQVGKAFREFRAVRVVRAFRLVSALNTLRDLVIALGTAIPRVSRVLPLIFLIFYIYAVLFVELFRDVQFDDGYQYFGRLDYALFTCLEMMTMQWAEIAREAMEKSDQWWAHVLFVIFVATSGFLFFDLIKAIVCDSVAVIDGRSQRLAKISRLRKRLKRLGQGIDNVSHRVVHTINFQNHINRMMLSDIKDMVAKGRTRQEKKRKKRKT